METPRDEALQDKGKSVKKMVRICHAYTYIGYIIIYNKINEVVGDHKEQGSVEAYGANAVQNNNETGKRRKRKRVKETVSFYPS